jgi:hypothetical protein
MMRNSIIRDIQAKLGSNNIIQMEKLRSYN